MVSKDEAIPGLTILRLERNQYWSICVRYQQNTVCSNLPVSQLRPIVVGLHLHPCIEGCIIGRLGGGLTSSIHSTENLLQLSVTLRIQCEERWADTHTQSLTPEKMGEDTTSQKWAIVCAHRKGSRNYFSMQSRCNFSFVGHRISDIRIHTVPGTKQATDNL